MRKSLSSVLDAAERAGRASLSHADVAAALPDISAEALRQALHRQQARGRIVRVSRGANHWLIVPLQYAEAGAPPLEAWLDRYLSKSLATPYYVALLSAAALYGAAPQGVMVTQIMVPKPRRTVTVGRHQLVFTTRADVAALPTRWHETPDGRVKISTPELTALDLVQRADSAGGMSSVREIVRRMAEISTPGGLEEALDAARQVPVAQRLGALYALDGSDELAGTVADWLRGKSFRAVALDPAATGDSRLDETFKVRMPHMIALANA